MKKKETLWTRDFSRITIATVLSAIGGEAMNLPISLLVFDETNSTMLSALILVCGMLPDVVLPILVAPFIDKGEKKGWIVGLDLLLAVLYAFMGFWVGGHEFVFGLYLGFTLLVGTISVFYRLAYDAWYPDLIPAGFEQKGYAVSTAIYSFVVIFAAPVTAYFYERVSMQQMFFLVSGITFVSVLTESFIREEKKVNKDKYTFRQYCSDMKEGFVWLKTEKGIRNIYSYMSITEGTSQGIGLITQAWCQSQFSAAAFGFIRFAEMLGRALSSLFQYVKEIPVKKRYAFTKFVYFFYSLMDMLLLFCPYPAMLANRFLCGGLGTSSATIRETAVKSYLPAEMRARVNALFSVIFAVGGVCFQFLAGVLGDLMPYRAVVLLLSAITIGSMFFLIVLPSKENRPVYEAVRK